MKSICRTCLLLDKKRRVRNLIRFQVISAQNHIGPGSQIEELHSVKDIDLLYIERLTRNVCFAIHIEGLKKLNEG